jgi:hypothetical protein
MVWRAVPSAHPFSMADYRRRLPHFHPDDAYLFLTGVCGVHSQPYCHLAHTTRHAFVAADRALERDRTGPVMNSTPG